MEVLPKKPGYCKRRTNDCGNIPASLFRFMLRHRSKTRQQRTLSSVYRMWLSDKNDCQAVTVSKR